MARRSVIPKDRFPHAAKVLPPSQQVEVHPLDEEEELPRACMYVSNFHPRGEDIWTSHGRKIKDEEMIQDVKRHWITLEKPQRDPRTGIVSPREYTHHMQLPFRSDDNPFVKQNGFTSEEVIRAMRSAPALEAGKILEKEITEEQLLEEKELRKKLRASKWTPPEAPVIESVQGGAAPQSWGEDMPMPTGTLAGMAQA